MIALVGQELVFAALQIPSYNVFRDEFDAIRLLIEFGTVVVILALTLRILESTIPE